MVVASNKVKIAHIADCHLRTRQYGSRARGRMFLHGLLSAVKAAMDAGCKVILCAGDIMDTVNPGSEVCLTQLDKVDGLLRGHATMLVTSGNHDSVSPHWCSRYESRATGGISFIDNQTVPVAFPSSGDTVPLNVTGLPYMLPGEFRERIQSAAEESDIVMWHGEIKEFCGYPKPTAVEMSDIPAGRMSLLAMGDQHVHKYLRAPSGVLVSYPGSTEMWSADEDEHKKLWVYTYAFADGKWALEAVEDIPFDTQEVQRLSAGTEEELREAVDSIRDGALVYLAYDKSLDSIPVRDMVNRHIEKLEESRLPGNDPLCHTIVNLRIVSGKEETFVERLVAAGSIPSPYEFVKEKADEIFAPEDKDRLTDVCADLLDPDIDCKQTIDKFCVKSMEGTITV